MVLRGQVSVPVGNVVGHPPVNARPESQLGGDAVAANDLVFSSFFAPRVAVFLVGRLGQPGFVMSSQPNVLDDLQALEEEPVLAILMDPAEAHVVGDDPLKESKY